MEPKKPFRYFAIRVASSLIFRRTVDKITRVKSSLSKPGFKLEQVSYTGGRVIGSMPYAEWRRLGKREIADNGYCAVTRDTYRALQPYMQKGEL